MYRLRPILDEMEIRKRKSCVRRATDMLTRVSPKCVCWSGGRNNAAAREEAAFIAAQTYRQAYIRG